MKLYYDRENPEQRRRERRRFIDGVLKLALAWMIIIAIGTSIKSEAQGFERHVIIAIMIMFSTFFGTLFYLNYNTYRKNKP